MSEQKNFRMERIERLLDELRYEVERGLSQREIDENIVYRFVFPISHSIPDGAVFCEFRTRPVPYYYMTPDDVVLDNPRLKIVKS